MFSGVKVVEVGSWVMVPSAAVLLADYGAEVIKIERPEGGDPARGLVTGGVSPMQGTVNLMVEQVNRGKRSLGLDLGSEEGRQILYDLVRDADVFVTNLLPAARGSLQIDVDAIRAVNPSIIYAKADAVGPEGPEAGKPGYDSAVFFGRAGILNSFTRSGEELASTRPGFGDKTAGLALAFGIASALFRRERTGAGSVVDVSLLGSAMWVASSDIVYSRALGTDFSRLEQRGTNPIGGTAYETSDGRWINLSMLEPQRWIAPLLRAIGHEELLDDPHFADSAALTRHADECRAVLASIFVTAPLTVWKERLSALEAPWEVIADSFEVSWDPQALANGYITGVEHPSGEVLNVVRAPVTFDEQQTALAIAPEFSQHAEEILLETGRTWDDIIALKDRGVVP